MQQKIGGVYSQVARLGVGKTCAHLKALAALQCLFTILQMPLESHHRPVPSVSTNVYI